MKGSFATCFVLVWLLMHSAHSCCQEQPPVKDAAKQSGTKPVEEKPAWQRAAEKQALPLIEKKQLNALVIGVITTDGKKQYLTLGEKPSTLAKLDEHTIFEIGSITKTMTAFLLADAIQRLEMKLDDTLESLLPKEMTVPKRGERLLTVEDLATHTSGLPRLPAGLTTTLMLDVKLQEDPYARFDTAHLTKSLPQTKLKESPQPKVEYSNFGMGLLGFALTQKYKKSYEILLQERLFTPLGMSSSSTVVPKKDLGRFIDCFKADGQPSQHWTFHDTLAGAGAVRSTAYDMLLFTEAAMGRAKKLQPSFELVTAPQFEMERKQHIALGWFILEFKGKRAWWHNGGTGGFSSFTGFCKQPGVAVIVLSNRSSPSGAIDQIGMKVLESLVTGEK